MKKNEHSFLISWSLSICPISVLFRDTPVTMLFLEKETFSLKLRDYSFFSSNNSSSAKEDEIIFRLSRALSTTRHSPSTRTFFSRSSIEGHVLPKVSDEIFTSSYDFSPTGQDEIGFTLSMASSTSKPSLSTKTSLTGFSL